MRDRLRTGSLRRRLTMGYAGIALLTVLLLGAILAVALPPFFRQLDQTYVRNAASHALNALTKSGGIGPANSASLDQLVASIAAAEQVRLKVTDASGAFLADSGPPADPTAVSAASHTQDVVNPDGRLVGHIEVSGGPKAGAGLTASIAWAWAIAGTLAVIVSAAFGYFLARRISDPIAELTRVSEEMARGALSVRADVSGEGEVLMLATAFNEMADGVESTVESLSRFVGDAAHEIGTPLTALQADLELARQAPADASVPDLLDRSLAHADRIRKLTRDLLALSRLESVGAIAERSSVDLGEVAAAAIDSVASRAEYANIELAFDDQAESARVSGDPAALGRAIGNLFDNALKFTPSGGKVTASVRREDPYAVLRVQDTGLGVSAEDLPHVFERFHRGRATSSIPGSGLGLAIVKAIVDAHSGSVTLSSGGDGTVAEMKIPLEEG